VIVAKSGACSGPGSAAQRFTLHRVRDRVAVRFVATQGEGRSSMANVVLRNVRKTYAGNVEATKGISFEVGDGQFCVLVGPSGCGKSTLLRMVAGLETITSGEIDIGGRIVNEVEPAERDIAMVFQNYALYPHMSVYNNMAYGLRNRGMAKPEIDTRVREAAQILEIGPMLDRKPRQLSGGQRQRVAMGRAIVRQPKVFLFDEPLSNLDAKLRIAMRVEIRKLQRRLGTTSIYVTHDQLEAMTLADILVVMNGGLVEQIGNPLDIYQKPATTFVASFIGAPPMNLIPLQGADAGLADAGGEAGILGIRPEDFVLSNDPAPSGAVALDLAVEAIERVGAETYVYGVRSRQGDRPAVSAKPGELPPGEILVRVPGQVGPAIGARVRVVAARDKLHLFSADGRKRIDS
jgi:sn-glycerol 3-phosphate transport system ATP-binding protein